MYIKLAKILALGVGAVITTGIPSGFINSEVDTSHKVRVYKTYALQDVDTGYFTSGSSQVKLTDVEPSVVVNFGANEEPQKTIESQEPTNYYTPAVVTNVKDTYKDIEKKIFRPLTIPKIKVIVPGYIPAPARSADTGYAPTYYSGIIEPDYAAPVQQDSLFSSQSAEASSYEALCATLCAAANIEAAELRASSYDGAGGGGVGGGIGGPGSGIPGDDTGGSEVHVVTTVPEPSGLLGLLAALPGLALLRRRR